MSLTGKNNLIILPTYNEKENIVAIIAAIFAVVPDTHILVVDDQSPDGTSTIVANLQEPRVYILNRTGKRGLGRAYIDGFRWALERHYETVFEMDADFSHQPKYLPDFLQAIENHDIVLGCRYMQGGGIEGWAPHRLLLSKGGNWYAKKVLRLPYTDITGGFKCFRRKALQMIDLDSVISNGYHFQIELTWYAHLANLRIGEIPIIFPDREKGTSKMNLSVFHEAFLGVWRLRWHNRHR